MVVVISMICTTEKNFFNLFIFIFQKNIYNQESTFMHYATFNII